MKTIQFEGQTHQFPDDFTDQEISSALASSGSSPPTATAGAPSGTNEPDMSGARGGVMSYTGGAIEGVPLVGPAVKGGLDKAIAGARSLIHGTSYEDELKGVQNRYQSAAEQNPTLNTAGEITGGTLPYLAAGAYAPAARALGLTGSLGSQILLGGASSGAINAADAAIRGGDPVTAGAIGAAVGAGAPVLGAAASKVASPITSTMRGLFNPTKEAERRVASAIARDVANPAMTPAEHAAAFAAGEPVTALEQGGETTRALARSAANTSPEGRAALEQTVNERALTSGDRVSDWLKSQYNYPDTFAQQEALKAAAKTSNKAAYQQAFQAGEKGLWSPELERLAGSDTVAAAMKSAAKNAKDEAIVGGHGAMNPRITFTPDGRIQFNKGPTGVPTYPDLQYWDLVRRELGDASRRAGFGTEEARRVGRFASALNTELDRLVPSYQAARQGAAEAFGAQDALEAGKKFATSNMSNSAAASALGKMSPSERKLFTDGYVDGLAQKASNPTGVTSLTRKLTGSESERNRLSMVLGPQRAQEFIGLLNREKAMGQAQGAITKNSTTARQLAELGLAGAGYEYGSGGNPFNVNPAALTYAAAGYGLGRGRRAINTNVAKEVANTLTRSTAPTVAALPVRPPLTSILGRGTLPAITQSMLGPVQPLPGQQRLLRP